ncbi:MAG TPA: zinc ribbon domain-containing protein [Gemmatimonadaceae bacterium]|nr:zinc ribbon domain-containing protein [Gemmatimonadaceae bacterium]
MPTYEFRCPLGHEFEKFYRSIGVAQSQASCPECGQLAERMMSAGAGLVFKGSGFYLTDYGKNAHQKRGPGDGKPDGGKSESGSGEGAKAEGGKSEGAKSESGGGDSSAGSGTSGKSEAKSESKAADPKSSAPPKPSAGE